MKQVALGFHRDAIAFNMAPRLASTAMARTAHIEGVYRYTLTREWADGPSVCWVMLNPSTADAATDDPTIRKVIEFSRRWGYGAVVVVNLFALRSTNPAELLRHADPVGPRNQETLERELSGATLVVAAWGAHPAVAKLGAAKRLLSWAPEMFCVRATKHGAPAHPLYTPYTTEPLTFWRGREQAGAKS